MYTRHYVIINFNCVRCVKNETINTLYTQALVVYAIQEY